MREVPLETLRRVVDEMWRLKLNHLHLHLTDDEAWRIEIPAFPNLTEIGSRREVTRVKVTDSEAALTHT